MSGRSRPRANHNQDADEERRLWKGIKDKAREIDLMVTRSNSIGNEILDIEIQQFDLIQADKSPDASLDKRLEDLYRENVKICEEVQHLISGSSSDMNVLDSINILAGLREASSAELAFAATAPITQRDRVASGKVARDRPKKNGSKGTNSVAATEDGADDVSAAPSPRVSLSQINRLAAKEKSSRASSIPATRETSVKIEDGVESVASSVDTAQSASGGGGKSAGQPSAAARAASRITFKTGETVFYRYKDEKSGGEGIVCQVTAVIGEGKQRRYEVQDIDTDSTAAQPIPGGGKATGFTRLNDSGSNSFRASVSSLMQIPVSNVKLPDLPQGKQVMALYPETTTFYKGIISAAWKAKDGEQSVKVLFDGETSETSQDVERRFVLGDR
ncbi:hypothetical protein B0A48_17693 [Cryoendolithus antarcticus]|uniref:SGF29 C-terminal domain-containing protein n=1 Tax=Cryoendolithus antarcticus TaxID=1507870 RepID=A0A1V8SAL7_9PEZI|nr:hypothetical protein B0A48_17693 [Cryoendolithus antarcticus]